MKFAWSLFLYGAFLTLPASSTYLPCIEFTINCNGDFECMQTVLAAMVSIQVFCIRDQQPLQTCPDHCQDNLRIFLEASFGYDLMKCDCSEPGMWGEVDDCQHGQRAANVCISDIESYSSASNDQCDLDFQQCLREAICSAVWENYLLECAPLLAGQDCSNYICPLVAAVLANELPSLVGCDCNNIPGPWCLGKIVGECPTEMSQLNVTANNSSDWTNTTDYYDEENGAGVRLMSTEPTFLLYYLFLAAMLFILPF